MARRAEKPDFPGFGAHFAQNSRLPRKPRPEAPANLTQRTDSVLLEGCGVSGITVGVLTGGGGGQFGGCCHCGIGGWAICALIMNQHRHASTTASSFSRQLRTSMFLNRVAQFILRLLFFFLLAHGGIVAALAGENFIDTRAQFLGLQIVLQLAVVAE